MSDPDPTLKILLIGPASGGKTSLLLRYTDDIFNPDSSTATIGVDFKIKKISVRGQPYRLLLFDTAGQERFRTLTSSYYRNAQGVILVYDTSNRDSFISMDHWFTEAETYAGEGVVKCLVGSKIDKNRRAVKTEEGEALAERYGALFCEVSSKRGDGCKMPFLDVVAKIVENPELLSGAKKVAASKGSGVQVTEPSAGWCSC